MDKKEIFKKIITEFRESAYSVFSRDLTLPRNTGKVVSLYGPRRSGKTYLFYRTIELLLKSGVSPEKVLYVNLEDERISPLSKEDGQLILDAYYELNPENIDGDKYFFFDEIQVLPMWEKFIRRLSERPDTDIFLTGSSSRLFSKEIATALRGRTLSYPLMPLSFGEVLSFKGIKRERHLFHSKARYKVQKLFNEYLRFGGFPEVLDKKLDIKTRILQEYFELIFYRDIVERYKIRNFTLMRELMRYMLSHFSSLFSVSAYYNMLKSAGFKIGKDTLFEYVSCLEDVGFVKTAALFDYSLKKQIVNPKKIYAVDAGLINAVSFQFSENKGRLLENIVFLELIRREKDVYYYRTKKGREVDFAVKRGRKISELIQVAQQLSRKNTKEREVTALSSAMDEQNLREGLILTENEEATIEIGQKRVKVIPVCKWLLSQHF